MNITVHKRVEHSRPDSTQPNSITYILLDFSSGRVESPAVPLISSSDLTGIDSESNNNILSGVGCYNEMNHTHTIILRVYWSSVEASTNVSTFYRLRWR
jgi:hypothetical protein